MMDASMALHRSDVWKDLIKAPTRIAPENVTYLPLSSAMTHLPWVWYHQRNTVTPVASCTFQAKRNDVHTRLLKICTIG
ncbi:hypothetical protein CC1G_14160 [Coprinopsis cinerea okayama7|uniref:Uncharacterized protein n=1 Tax=Coprinopsis cinerea (strain Okayama-7 / 130 / ATCC MYA-4618 / FGSC 9003) TaxID=240176 RepID=D6RL61_COPC7|nr:hypothetical protein CC1G_14160 [Coprinopsis cinerea okayama7\|eukprot:XP_002911627.1 hypothetical protein CC1G_14160 [Coprinopsis cinerea okayama7\